MVRPVRHFELGEFCTRLTGIAQAEVDAARGFAEVPADFVAWAGAGEHWLCSWGVNDRRQLAYDAEFHGVALPEWFVTRHVNIRRGFIRWRGIDRCGLLDACKLIRDYVDEVLMAWPPLFPEMFEPDADAVDPARA